MRHYRVALERNPGELEATLGLAVALERSGRPGEAAAALERVVARTPRLNGSCPWPPGRPPASTRRRGSGCWRAATRLRPDDPELQLALGAAVGSRPPVGRGARRYRRTLELQPRSADARQQPGPAVGDRRRPAVRDPRRRCRSRASCPAPLAAPSGAAQYSRVALASAGERAEAEKALAEAAAIARGAGHPELAARSSGSSSRSVRAGLLRRPRPAGREGRVARTTRSTCRPWGNVQLNGSSRTRSRWRPRTSRSGTTTTGGAFAAYGSVLDNESSARPRCCRSSAAAAWIVAWGMLRLRLWRRSPEPSCPPSLLGSNNLHDGCLCSRRPGGGPGAGARPSPHHGAGIGRKPTAQARSGMVVATTRLDQEGALRKVMTAAIVVVDAGRAMASKGTRCLPRRRGAIRPARRDPAGGVAVEPRPTGGRRPAGLCSTSATVRLRVVGGWRIRR